MFSSAAVSRGRNVAAGSSDPAARRSPIASETSVTRWLAPCARAAWYRVRLCSSTQTTRPERSSTSWAATSRSALAAVTPKAQSARRGRSTSVPVKVIAGCIAIGLAPISAAGSSIPETVPAAGVHDVLAGMDRAGGDEHPDDIVERVIGDRQQQ